MAIKLFEFQEQLACNTPPVLRIFNNSLKTTYIGNEIFILWMYSDSIQ